MNKKASLFPSQGFQQPCSVEFEIPVVLLRLVTGLLDCQETFLVQTEMPFATKIVKNDNYVKFFFKGDDNCRPLVELVNDRWRCKIAAGNDVDCFKVSELNGAVLEAVQVNSDKLDAGQIQSVAETEDQICSIKIEQALTDEILTAVIEEKVADENKLKRPRQSKRSTKKRCKKAGKTEPSSDSQPDEQNVEAMLFSSRENSEKLEELEQTSIAVGASEEMLLSDELSSTNQARRNPKRSKQEENATIGCPGCTKFFDSMNKLMYHVRQNHKNEPDYNELKKKLEDLMYEHSSRSQSLLVQNCSVCGRERRGVTLLNHLTVWHSDCENYEQLIDEAKARYHKNKLAVKLEREKYLFRQQTNVCPYCSKNFAHRASYRKHVTYTCELNPNRRPLFNCNTCGYSSPNTELFKRHQEQHGTGTKFVCDLCGKEYCNRSGLVVHQRDIHRITKKMPIRYHVCPECQQEFYCKNHYERHVRTHYDDRPMQCDLCGKQFKHLDHLNRHRREIHQNKYRYHCEKCGHGMAKLSYLKAHKCGRIRRAQSAQFESDKNDSKETRPDTADAKQTQSVNSENEPTEQFVYSELFTGTQDKPAEGTFVLGVYNPTCSSAPSLYQLPDGLQSLGWTPNASAELIADNSSSNALMSSLLSNL